MVSIRDDGPSFDEVKSRLRLTDIVERDGVKLKREGRYMVGLSPFTSERTPSFKIKDERFKCYSSQLGGDVFDYLALSRKLSAGEAFKEACRMAGIEKGKPLKPIDQRKRRAEDDRRDEDEVRRKAKMHGKAIAIWSSCVPMGGTLAETYLRSRSIPYDLVPWNGEIRFSKSVRNRSGEYFPAMVARICDPYGKMTGVHCTFLDPRTGKRIEAVGGRIGKQIFGGYYGGSCRIIDEPFADKRGGIATESCAIGEGIETVVSAFILSLREGNRGGAWWAALALGNLTGTQARDDRGDLAFAGKVRKNAPDQKNRTPLSDLKRPGMIMPPGYCGSVRILAEDDLKPCKRTGVSGRERAETHFALAAQKFIATGCYPVIVSWPSVGGDFNDVLVSREGDANAKF